MRDSANTCSNPLMSILSPPRKPVRNLPVRNLFQFLHRCQCLRLLLWRSFLSWMRSCLLLMTLLRRIPSFTNRETLIQNVRVLFLATQWILIEINNDLNGFFIARLSYGTSDSAISRIMPMQDYMTFETVEMVSCLPFFAHFSLASCFTTIFLLSSQVIARV